MNITSLDDFNKTPCPNCGEYLKECACFRNKCIRCGRPVGNITFDICEECYIKEPIKIIGSCVPCDNYCNRKIELEEEK